VSAVHLLQDWSSSSSSQRKNAMQRGAGAFSASLTMSLTEPPGRRSLTPLTSWASLRQPSGAWIDLGVLTAVPGRGPIRVRVSSLAAGKQAIDEIHRHKDDRHILVDVLHLLRDRAALAGGDAAEGINDAVAGRVTKLDKARLDELVPSPQETQAIEVDLTLTATRQIKALPGRCARAAHQALEELRPRLRSAGLPAVRR